MTQNASPVTLTREGEQTVLTTRYSPATVRLVGPNGVIGARTIAPASEWRLTLPAVGISIEVQMSNGQWKGVFA